MVSDTAPARTHTFHHAELGPMTGLVSPENVVQFRGIPFASIPARFKQSIVLEALPENLTDFTKYTYACPQEFPDDSTGGGRFPGVDPPVASEFDCLNLHINVPLACLEPNTRLSELPVLIYIHGGGFVLGRIDEPHNTALMVEQSILDSQPTIAASIQYRLGALANLYTPETEHANRGLIDQRNALIWIQRFIAGFGGDPRRVTVFGESAGSMSICAHMLSHPPSSGPLFTRAILMSGVLGPMTEAIPAEEAEANFENFLKLLGIREVGEEGLARLRQFAIGAIVNATSVVNNAGSMWLPVRTPGFFTEEAQHLTWDTLPETIAKCEWVEEVILGVTTSEGTPHAERVASVTPQAFLAGIQEKMGEKSANLVSQTYEMTPDMDQNLFTTRALRWIGDVIFDSPIHAWAKSATTQSNKKIYRYVFDVRNPFPNHSLFQQAHHWVDKYFVFKNHQFRYPTQRLKDISTRHAQLWIDFANGKAPWTEYKYTGNGDEIIMVADERDGWVERTVKENERISGYSLRTSEGLWKSWDDEKGKPLAPVKIAAFEGKKMT